MFHSKRVWCVSPVASAEELAKKLTEMTWCCCTGFQIGSYLWLNDSTCPDGAQEFAVVKAVDTDTWIQLESITFGWCDETTALEYIRHTLAGGDDHHSFRRAVDPVLQTPADHSRCPHCA